MKKLKSANLAVKLYADRENKIPVTKDGKDGEALTVKDFILISLDQPIQEKPLTRERLKSLDRIVLTLTLPETTLEDADFEFLKTFIEDCKIRSPLIYSNVTKAIDDLES